MSNESNFDPTAFLDATTTEANERRDPLPEENPDAADKLYTAVIGEIDTKNFKTGIIGKGERTGQPWLSAGIPLRIQVPASLQQQRGLPPELIITDNLFMDLTPAGTLDNSKGKNRGQMNYRIACGMNKAGEPFSLRMLGGKVVKVKIKHEMYNEAIQERIAGVFAS